MRKDGAVVARGGKRDQAKWGRGLSFYCFKVSFAGIVHPIDYSGGAVLVRLSGRHLFPKGGFQS